MKSIKNLLSRLSVFVVLVFSSLVFCACPGPDPIDDDVQDYYVEFSVNDIGTLTNQEATIMVGNLNAEGYFIDDCSRSEAIHYFDEWARDLSRELNYDTYYFEAVIAMSLKDERKNTVKQHLLKFSKNGCRLD